MYLRLDEGIVQPRQLGYICPNFLQAFTMLFFPDLTTPVLTAKPDLEALFSGPIKNYPQFKGINIRFDQIHISFYIIYPFLANIEYYAYKRRKIKSERHTKA